MAAGKLIQVVAVSARDRSVDRGVNLDGIDWYDEAPKLAERDDIDIIVEMIGGSEGVALDLARAALESGKHVITANKAMIAHHGAELAQLAETNGVHLLFESAVAGVFQQLKLCARDLPGIRSRALPVF